MIYLSMQVAYGGLTLVTSLLNNVFLLFYVSTFILVYQIDSTSFFIGETIFLIWNSLNDPLFGWLSDSDTIHDNKLKNQHEILTNRIKALYKFGPLFCLSFLLFWFNFIHVGIQFSVALCLYDSFLTMVDLNHQALLADLAIDSESRVRYNSYCSAFSAAGCISVFLSYKYWSKANLFHFQVFCILLSMIGCLGMMYCCKSMLSHVNNASFQSTSVAVGESQAKKIGSFNDLKKYTSQVLKHRNFLLFASMNLIQVFHCHFNSNFFPVFIQYLLGHTVSPTTGAIMLGISFFVPHVNNLYFLHLCKVFGTYLIVKCLFATKLVLGLLMWYFGIEYWYLLCLFVISNRVFTEGTCQLLNLVVSDLVDEDYVKFKRKSPVSALVFGTAALLSKPGQTLAPLLGAYLLYLQTGKSIFLKENVSSINNESATEFGSFEERLRFKEGCFVILTLTPIVCAILQLILWQLFSLHGRRLKSIKTERKNIEKKLFQWENV